MKAKQIASFVNDVLKETIGKKAPTIKDTSDLVAFAGKLETDTAGEIRDPLYNTIIDKVRKTYVYSRTWRRTNRFIRRDPGEWATWYEELSVSTGDGVENASWQKESASAWDVNTTTKVQARYFRALATWEHDEFVSDRLLIGAFTSFEKFNALISAMFVSLENHVEKELAELENLAICTAIAGTIKNANPAQVRHVLTEYNTIKGTSFTSDDAVYEPLYLKYVTRQIQDTYDFITKEYTTIYNAEGELRNSPEDKLTLEMLTSFMHILEVNMQSDVFQRDTVKLPRFSKIPYWQSGGEKMDYADCSKINITNESYKNLLITDGEVLELEQGNIIACIRDENAVISCANRIVTKSIYNPKQERTNYFKKCEAGFGVNLSHNMVVFIND